MKPKYEVVHCETQEEWDFVNENIDPKFRLTNEWFIEKENTCKVLNLAQYSHIRFFKDNNSTIYSFSEWCILENLKKEDLSYLTEFLIKNEIT